VLVVTQGPLIATLGVRDLIVVCTNDAVLVCPRARAQDVRHVAAAERSNRLDTSGIDGRQAGASCCQTPKGQSTQLREDSQSVLQILHRFLVNVFWRLGSIDEVDISTMETL